MGKTAVRDKIQGMIGYVSKKFLFVRGRTEHGWEGGLGAARE